ncbi:MAG: Gfo/Idh/MocA family oxidoreductase [Planctomycetota bacterium]
MTTSRTLTRRAFTHDALLAAAASAVVPATLFAASPARRKDGDPLRVAVLGVRGRGRAHIAGFTNSKDSVVTCICDPDEGVIEPAQMAVPEARYVKDLRRVMDDDRIDVVSIATPNHWHSLAAILALDAGKHVYVEKPVSQTLGDGLALVAAAARSGKVVQTGTQARSHPATREAIAWMRAGGLGRVLRATGLCYKRRESIGKVDGPQDPPATLDYDLWCGPAPLVPLRRASLHYDWHWSFDTGNGDIGNQGVHQVDIARWGLGVDGFPRSAVSVGGRFGYDDDGETPNTHVVHYDCGDTELVFEVRGLVTEPYRGANIGVVFECEDGYLVSSAYNHVVAYDANGVEVRSFSGGSEQDHYQNFLDAVRAGDPGAVNADATCGHVSAGWCHLGNVSHRLGRTAAPHDAHDELGASDSSHTALARTLEHLAANQVATVGFEWTVGPEVRFDGERFTGASSERANALVQREARAPFVVPG